MRVRLLFEPRDWWIGFYWNREQSVADMDEVNIYICAVPCLPIRITYFLTGVKR